MQYRKTQSGRKAAAPVFTGIIGLLALAAQQTMAAPYQNAVLKLTPNFYYQLNETSTASGVIDSTGNATGPSSYNGDYVNGPAQVGGPGPTEVYGGIQVPGVGGAANLAHYSNNAGHIILGSGADYGANDMTVAFFMKAGPSQGGDRLFTNNLADPALSFQIDCGNDGLVVAPGPNTGGPDNQRTLYMEDGSGPDRRLIDPNAGWFHVVASTHGTTGPERAANVRVWINGKDRTADLRGDATGWGIETSFAKIGGRGDDPTAPQTHSGAQDEMAIWKRALTDEEVASLWTAARTTPVLSDNFNAPDNASFDASLQTDRRGGLLGPDVQLRSSRFQHAINGNRLKMGGAEGRVRFHDIAGGLTTWHNFASGPAGAAILEEGGFRVEFDWTASTTTSSNWIEISAGISGQNVAEPNPRVNHSGTDFGILFRDNGGVQYFKNGPAVADLPGAFTPTLNPRHVRVDFGFGSFADGSNVKANAWVDGTKVLSDYTFTWNGNAGANYFEFGSFTNVNYIDNFSMTTLGVFLPDIDADGLADDWEMDKAGNLTDLNGQLTGPGPGAGTGNFDGDTLTDAQEYALRLSYPALNPKASDTDNDGLEDGLEIAGSPPRPATNPTTADSDGDGLVDGVESNSGTFAGPGDSGSNPSNADTDGDQYPDGYEVQQGGDPVAGSTLPATLPAGIALGIVTDEASTGISADEIFTHKISGGSATTVNGVLLDVLDPTNTPPNFEWNGFAGGKNIIGPAINNNTWVPANGNVTGPGNLQMFGTFTYSGGGAGIGNKQSFTLSALEPGKSYEMRIFIRKWDPSTVRPAALKFTNGAQVTNYFILEDRPVTVTGGGNEDTAYYISYSYVAQASTLTLESTVPNVSTGNGSFHLYGLTNREAGPPPPFDFISTERAEDGSSMTLTIATRAGHTYAVDFSTDLVNWTELTDALPATGTTTVYVDTVASNFRRAQYRVRDVTP